MHTHYSLILDKLLESVMYNTIKCFSLTRDCSVRPKQYSNIVFTCIFIIEAILRIIALRWGYFLHPWNVFDFVVVLLSIIGELRLDNAFFCYPVINNTMIAPFDWWC